MKKLPKSPNEIAVYAAAAFLCVASPALAAPHHGQRIEVSGYPRIEDGDTVQFSKMRVRFLCIDTPESDQPFGQQATDYLTQLIGNKNVRCIGHFFDKYNRLLAICSTRSDNLNLRLVESSHAVSYGSGKACADYKSAADSARENHIGVWSDPDFIMPSAWRKSHPNHHTNKDNLEGETEPPPQPQQ